MTATVQEICALASITAATCTATVKATADGTSKTTSTSTVLSGSHYYRFDVEITAGAEKTMNPTATCGSKKGTAASLNSGMIAMWALTGVIGVASIITMF